MFNINIGLVIMVVLFGLLGGILLGTVIALVKLYLEERKTKKQWKNNKGIFKLEEGKEQLNINEEEQENGERI